MIRGSIMVPSNPKKWFDGSIWGCEQLSVLGVLDLTHTGTNLAHRPFAGYWNPTWPNTRILHLWFWPIQPSFNSTEIKINLDPFWGHLWSIHLQTACIIQPASWEATAPPPTPDLDLPFLETLWGLQTPAVNKIVSYSPISSWINCWFFPYLHRFAKKKPSFSPKMGLSKRETISTFLNPMVESSNFHIFPILSPLHLPQLEVSPTPCLPREVWPAQRIFAHQCPAGTMEYLNGLVRNFRGPPWAFANLFKGRLVLSNLAWRILGVLQWCPGNNMIRFGLE